MSEERQRKRERERHGVREREKILNTPLKSCLTTRIMVLMISVCRVQHSRGKQQVLPRQHSSWTAGAECGL